MVLLRFRVGVLTLVKQKKKEHYLYVYIVLCFFNDDRSCPVNKLLLVITGVDFSECSHAS